jgi:hypothetical protein
MTCRCAHCGGTGIEPKLDGATLIATIFNAIGSTPFTTRELRHHAKVEPALLELLGDRDPKTIGWLLKSIEGASLGDFQLVRLGKARGSVALWKVEVTLPVLPKPSKSLAGRPSRVR